MIELPPKINYYVYNGKVTIHGLKTWTQDKNLLKRKISLNGLKPSIKIKQGPWQTLRKLYFEKIKTENLMSIMTNENFILSSVFKLIKNKGKLTKGSPTPEKEMTSYSLPRQKFIKRLEQLPQTVEIKDIKLISKSLKKGNFPFLIYRRIYIPKPNSTQLRPLSIPFFSDRIVQDGIKNILNAIYDRKFKELNVSFGFRENIGVHDAINKLTEGDTTWIIAIEGDVKGAYDNVNRKILLSSISETIIDKKFLKLLKKRLEVRVYDPISKKLEYLSKGIPQGGIDSPILYNIYSHEMDKEIINYLNSKTNGNFKYVRYADDFIILLRVQNKKAEKIKEDLTQLLKDKLEINLSNEKTLLTDLRIEKAHFLGFEITRTKTRKLELAIDESRMKIRNQLKGFTTKEGIPRIMMELKSLKKHSLINFFNSRLKGLCCFYKGTKTSTLLKYLYILRTSGIKTIKYFKAGNPTTSKLIINIDNKLREKSWNLLNYKTLLEEQSFPQNKITLMKPTYVSKKEEIDKRNFSYFQSGCLTCGKLEKNQLLVKTSTNNLNFFKLQKETFTINKGRYIKNINIYCQCTLCQKKGITEILDHRLLRPDNNICTLKNYNKSWQSKGWKLSKVNKINLKIMSGLENYRNAFTWGLENGITKTEMTNYIRKFKPLHPLKSMDELYYPLSELQLLKRKGEKLKKSETEIQLEKPDSTSTIDRLKQGFSLFSQQSRPDPLPIVEEEYIETFTTLSTKIEMVTTTVGINKITGEINKAELPNVLKKYLTKKLLEKLQLLD